MDAHQNGLGDQDGGEVGQGDQDVHLSVPRGFGAVSEC